MNTLFFFFNDTATTEIYTFPTRRSSDLAREQRLLQGCVARDREVLGVRQDSLDHLFRIRSEEHTSELQSPCNIVCRLLLEKKITTRRPVLTHKMTALTLA